MLKFIEPMYAKLVQELPEGREWQYEIKFDGYRCLAGRDSRGVRLWSRRGNLFTDQFPAIAGACTNLKTDTLVDGELIALDENGRISFNLLQHHRSKASALRFYVFDVLVWRGKSLLLEPLVARRERLSEAMEDLSDPVLISETFDGNPAELVGAAKELSVEGIIAKRKKSCYEPGKRTGAWVKYKINQAQEFVIGGYTPGNPLDSVIVGYYAGPDLIYAAKVRNGFVPRVRREVHARLKPIKTHICPFANLPEKKRTPWALTSEEMKHCRWVRPNIVAQVEFTEWTPEGHLRHCRFAGLREDKDAREVVREI